jgi:hypothetical protein
MCKLSRLCGIQVRLAAALVAWVLGSTSMSLAAAPPAGSEQAAAISEAEAAVKQASAAAEAYRNAEHYAAQQVNDASREIQRSERRQSETAVEELLAARADSSAKELAQKKLESMRAAAGRLIADSLVSDKAGRTEDACSKIMEEKAAATRVAEVQLLDLKAAAAAADEARAAEAARLRRQANETRAITALERQAWRRWSRATMEQLHERTTDAARIARRMVELENDPEQIQKLQEFIHAETETARYAHKRAAEDQAADDALLPEVYRWRSAALGGLAPLAAESWDRAKARHLLIRAGFGGTPQQVEKLTAMGLYKAVDYFVEYYRQPQDGPSFTARPEVPRDPLADQVRFIKGDAARQTINAPQLEQLRRWWLARMISSRRPLQEKLTLFWHGHFASQNSVVNDSYTMFKQNELFREHAAGNFGALLNGLIHDPAMIRYLDNNSNVKEHPNENLAREILELFSMGAYQGYDEQDVREAARALTGYTIDRRHGQFRYDATKHDTGKKTIFGKTGNWTGEDLVRLILEQPATSRYIAGKLGEFFAESEPPEEVVTRLASVLRETNYDLEAMLKNLFLSAEFYSPEVMGAEIKSPVELVVGALRDLGVEQLANAEPVDAVIRDMGQQLLEPPDVKGWRHGRAWISSKRMFSRFNGLGQLILSIPQPGEQGIDVVRFVERGDAASAEQVVDYLATACLARPLNDESRHALVEQLKSLPPRARWAQEHEAVNQMLRTVLILIVSQPEFQMG